MTLSEIDVKQLQEIQQRFEKLSQSRFTHMLGSFNMGQADAIKLLPLLFHENLPMLPGYIDKQTPCGIPNFSPSALQKKIAKSVSRSFQWRGRAYRQYQIAGLYLMGSTGTLAQSLRSDLDLWVCLNEPLDEKAFNKLRHKADLISLWMAEKGIELNCYLVFEQQFKRQSKKSIGSDSCGNTQNFLLLDEFYRTAIWLSGRMPLWWLIPPDEDYTEYSQRLLNHKHLSKLDWLDFGNVDAIPAEEHFSAALWQLYKALESPYKSALKLLMLEIYARHFPRAGLLSDDYKRRIYKDTNQLENLDPYLMVLNHAEAFLLDQPQRLEFMRRAFYLKTGVKIHLNKNKPSNWRYQKVKQLVETWGWNQPRLEYLNNRPNWRINSVESERVELVRELNHSYHFLANFARIQGVLNSSSQQELLALGRMLYARFERRAGKLDQINTGIARDVSEPTLTLQQKDNNWLLYLGLLNSEQIKHATPVYQAADMFSLLAWSVCNQLVNNRTNFRVESQQSFFTRQLAKRQVKDLLVLTEKGAPKLAEGVFQKPAETLKLGVFLNSQRDPLQTEKERNLYSVANQQDGFSWGESRLNLFSQFDVFWINSWGEHGCQSYSGEQAWLEFFIDNRTLISNQQEAIEFFSGGVMTMEKQKDRLIQLLNHWHKLELDSRRRQAACRFLMSVGNQFLRVDFFEKQVDYTLFRYSGQLLSSLSEPVKNNVTYSCDDNLYLPSMIKRVVARPAPTNYQCYLLQTTADVFTVMLRDPDGNVYFQKHKGGNCEQLISHYQQFFDSINQRLGFMQAPVSELEFWLGDLNRADDKSRFKRLKLSNNNIAGRYLTTQAIATRNSQGKIRFDLHTESESFLYRDYGELVYQKLVKSILKHRTNNSRYPLFITDLDLSIVIQQPGMMDYLNYKRMVEQKLANSLDKLAP